MSKNLQDPYLEELAAKGAPVAVYLVNGIKLSGVLESHDQYVVILKTPINQMVYKHAISTIVPSKKVDTRS